MSEPSRLAAWKEEVRNWNPFNKAGYTLLGGNKPTHMTARMATILKIAIGVASFFLLLLLLHPFATPERFGLQKIDPSSSIPNIVHFIYLKKDDGAKIHFPFSHFLTLYASVMYIKPSKIYIHSDFTAADIHKANRTGTIWTRKTLNSFPDIIQWNAVRAPSFAGPNDGKKIDSVEHKSGFLRWEQIARSGGIYLDWDVIPLRPLTPLLSSGFAFIAGRQYADSGPVGAVNGTINDGILMAQPSSAMARIMLREQTAGFTGKWEHNFNLMTSVAERLVAIPGQVLITDGTSFAPTSHSDASKRALFIPTKGASSPAPAVLRERYAALSGTSALPEVLAAYNEIARDKRARREWEMDFSASYVLHAFGMSEFNEHIVPQKILARKSNFGVATWEIAKRMVEDGVITGRELNWE